MMAEERYTSVFQPILNSDLILFVAAYRGQYSKDENTSHHFVMLTGSVRIR